MKRKVETSPNLPEVKISYQFKVKVADRITIRSPRDAYEELKTIYNPETIQHHEEFVVLLLNKAMHGLGWVKIAVGGIDFTASDVRIIFQHAIKANATAVVLSHNHPSGQLVPSDNDRKMTSIACNAGDALRIKVQDHLIVTDEGYFSFSEEGLM